MVMADVHERGIFVPGQNKFSIQYVPCPPQHLCTEMIHFDFWNQMSQISGYL